MKKILILIIVILILILGYFVLFNKNQQLPDQKKVDDITKQQENFKDPKMNNLSEETANWEVYRNKNLGISIKYPDNKNYLIENIDNKHVVITQEHPGNRFHIRTTDSDSVEGAFFTFNKKINNKEFRQFNYEGMGSGYGYMIEHDGKKHVFESVQGPINEVFELMMETLQFN